MSYEKSLESREEKYREKYRFNKFWGKNRASLLDLDLSVGKLKEERENEKKKKNKCIRYSKLNELSFNRHNKQDLKFCANIVRRLNRVNWIFDRHEMYNFIRIEFD